MSPSSTDWPTIVQARMTMVTQTPGGTIAHHALLIVASPVNAFSINLPHEIVLGSPRPRKVMNVSAKMARAIISTVFAIRSGATWGRTCLNTSRRLPAPSACARFTYTRSRTLFTWARISLAVLVQ